MKCQILFSGKNKKKYFSMLSNENFTLVLLNKDMYYCTELIQSTSHDTCCPHSCMIAQKVPNPAPLCPEMLAGALITVYT